jgi:flagella basal body P-ring formation protein FlgA
MPTRPEDPVIWRGRLLYDGQRSASVWAKVRITVERAWLVAAVDLPARHVIRSEELERASGRVFPYPDGAPQAAESIAGKIARRAIPRGQRILAALVQAPPEVARGDAVQVNATQGAAAITLEGVARSSGKKGDVIVVHNPASGRDFRAVVEDKGQVAALAAAGN